MEGRKVEILAPAGSAESVRAAVCAGADAVYIGGTKFGARAYAKNLTEDELLAAIDYVHIHGRRIYLTVNTLLKDPELEGLYEYLLPYYLRGLDGAIVQDIGVLLYLHEHLPGLAIHASTQMTVTGADGAAFLKDMGVVRAVPARELSLKEIRQMKERTGMEIECFVHGALCYCYSGQCLLSSMIGGRSGNRGQCAQPCRLPWQAKGHKPKDLMSLKDLCTIDLLPDLMEAGIDSFKIEGRMKQPDYVHTVTEIYRKYVDLYLTKGAEGYRVEEADRDRLYAAYRRRGYTDGYYRRHNGKDMISFGHMQGDREEPGGKEFKIQEKINGNLILSAGERAKLVLVHGDSRAECQGETVRPALRQPLDAERVRKQMRKTGNTEFCFEHFQVEMDGEVFLPVQALNELRREGIDRLAEAILKGHQRTRPGTYADKKRGEKGVDPKICPDAADGIQDGWQAGDRSCLSCAVQSFEQLQAAAGSEDIQRIYIDDELGLQDKTRQYLAKCRKGRQIFFTMPYILRMADMEALEKYYPVIETFYDGVLIRNWESYAWFLRHGYEKEICADGNLYVFNRYGKTFMERQGIRRYTAAAELNAGELRELDIRGAALSVYGYQTVMVTANCIQKTVDKCQKEGGYRYLRDRAQKRFAVRQCCRYRCCYNVIYNSAPLFLADKAKEVLKLMPGELRLDFTIETAEQVQNVLKVYGDAFLRGQDVRPPRTEFTRGHFKRGVK